MNDTMTPPRAFSSFRFSSHGFIADLDQQFPSYLSSWKNSIITLMRGDTHYGYVHEGEAFLQWNGKTFTLYPGMFFCAPGQAMIISHADMNCSGIVISRKIFNGLFQIGMTEHTGRLKYIDGCTDSLLIPPVIMGDPCLNLLYFPPEIDQTAHTHPSDRIGMIMSGEGECHADGGSIKLKAGMIFCIHAHGAHKFKTTDQDMRVLAYHPDSDFGPTHQDHPMINRTIVNGISANQLHDIQTK